MKRLTPATDTHRDDHPGGASRVRRPGAPVPGSEPAASTRATAPPARGGRQLLRDRVFGPFFLGKLVSTIGIWVHNIAAAIVVWELTRSALLVGAVSVGQFLPQLLLTPWSGAQADRGDRRRQIIAGRLVTASGSIGLVVWAAIAGLSGTNGAYVVIAAATVVGIGFALGGPAMNAVIPSLVRADELPAAIALSSVPFTVARASGPAIGALLVTTLGATFAFAIAAVTNLVFAAILWWLPIDLSRRRQAKDGRIRAGLSYVRSNPAILALLLGVATIGVGADPVITLTPSVAEGLGAGSGFVGVLASSFGIGAGLAFVMLSRLRLWLGLERLGIVGLLTLASGMLLLSVAPVAWLAIAALVIGGAGMTMALTSMTTLVQQQVPDELRGRVMALWSVAFLGSRPIAAGVSGAVTDATSVTIALLLVVVVLATGAAVARPSRTRAMSTT